jgi:hypothetical protein
VANTNYKPAGWPAVLPRISVDDPEALVAFIKHVFGATGDFTPARHGPGSVGKCLADCYTSWPVFVLVKRKPQSS